MNRRAIRDRLLEFGATIDPTELFPTIDDAAGRFAIENSFAFVLACCLDRGMPSSISWTIPYQLHQALGHLDPARLAAMSLEDLDRAYRSLLRQPRYVNDAPRRTRELANVVITTFDGEASKIWKGRSAGEVQATFRSLHGVGPGIASMALILIEKAYGDRFADLDRPGMDIKADVHTIRVLYRLGMTSTPTEDATIAAARTLHSRHPAALDAPLWIIGRKWCQPVGPRCDECPIERVCPRMLG
jgi:endonuclease III